MDLAGGVGLDHRGRIVDQHQFDAEFLAVGRLPDLARLEAVVGQDDRSPAGPDVQGKPHGVVLHRLVGRRALDLRQPFGRPEAILLDRGDAGRIRGFGDMSQFFRVDLFRCFFPCFFFGGENVGARCTA